MKKESVKDLKIIIKEDMLVNAETGEIVAYTKPKFQQLSYEDYVNAKVKYLVAQEATALNNSKLNNLLATEPVIGEIKFDGHRGITQLGLDANRLFSRRIAKETSWFAENTDQLPQLRDLIIPKELIGTILDGEILVDVPNCTCRTVQSVTGALPETAISWQLENKFAYLQAFDILFYKGYRITAMPLWKRKLFLANVVEEINSPFVRLGTMYATDDTLINLCKDYVNSKVKFLPFKELTTEFLEEHIEYVDDLKSVYKEVLSQGMEGLMIKPLNGIYEHKRGNNYIKMKPNLTFDVVIMGYDDPEHYFEGKTLDEGGTWNYWEDAEDDSVIVEHPYTGEQADDEGLIPVTKFYANDWIGAVKFGVYKFFTWDSLHEQFGDNGIEIMLDNGELIDTNAEGGRILVEVGQTSGMSDEVRDKISKNTLKMLGDVIEVKAQCIINPETGSLQHPRFSQFRPDKNSEACTFEDHLKAGEL